MKKYNANLPQVPEYSVVQPQEACDQAKTVHILLVTITYPPEIRAISFMMQELAEELALRGHNVTVITSQPKTYLSAELPQKPFNELSVENGIQVIRVKTLHSQKTNYLMRGISEISLPHLFYAKIKKYIKEKIDSIIVYSPPLTLGILGIKVKKRLGARYLLNIQDIFPQNAIDLGIIKNRFVEKYFERMEKKVYKKADKITAHSEYNRNFLIHEKNVPAKKISSIYNWIDLASYNEIEKTGALRTRYGLENKFIFLHAGIMGPAQGLDFIIKIAKEVREVTNICFLLVGDGSEKPWLEKMVDTYNLQNVVFKQFVSKLEYPLLAKDADVGLACLNRKNRTPVYPGKILGYMASSIPIVALLNKESDGHRIIQQAKCGYSIIANNSNKAAKLIRKVYNEKENLEQFGRNGFNYAKANFSKKACMDKLEELIKC